MSDEYHRDSAKNAVREVYYRIDNALRRKIHDVDDEYNGKLEEVDAAIEAVKRHLITNGVKVEIRYTISDVEILESHRKFQEIKITKEKIEALSELYKDYDFKIRVASVADLSTLATEARTKMESIVQ